MERQSRVPTFWRSLARQSRRQPLLSVVSGTLLILIVMTMFAPLIAPIPKAAAGWTAPPLPDRDEPLPGFQELLDPLPLIVRDLPDEASQEFVALYDQSWFTDHNAAANMVESAEAAIPIHPTLRRPWEAWLENKTDGTVPPAIMETLTSDSRNADKLNNLAVAIFFSVYSQSDGSLMMSSPISFAIAMLGSTSRAFPENRASLLNYVFLQSVTWVTSIDIELTEAFSSWITSHPDDLTALLLVTKLVVNGRSYGWSPPIHAIEGHAVALTESDDPRKIAFGYALQADLLLANLDLGSLKPLSRAEREPFTLLRSARLALNHYDQALEFSDDASIYSARSLTLVILGDTSGAITSQERAVEIDPDSVPLKLKLAELYSDREGTVADKRESVALARDIERDILLASESDVPTTFRNLLIIVADNEMIPLVSNRTHLIFQILNPPMAGGGFTVAFDEIDDFQAGPTARYGNNPMVRAALGSITKSELLGDVEGVRMDADSYIRLFENQHWPTTAVVSAEEYVKDQMQRSVLVAMLMNGDTGPSFDALSDTSSVSWAMHWLGFLGDYEGALALCKRSLEVRGPDDSENTRDECLPFALYRSGQYEQAARTFEQNGSTFYAAYAAERHGDLRNAERLYRETIGAQTFEGYSAKLRLSGVLLTTGEAQEAYELLSDWLDWDSQGACAEGWCTVTDHIRPQALSNRGIALLQMSADSNGNIDCIGDDWQACSDAWIDFDAALQFDPYNPVFLMNKAWVARLLGDDQMSAELMQRALESDPGLYPVHNDLGVLAITRGDREGAEQHFLNAIAAKPTYANALWNLGVLHMQRGLPGLVKGQAYLARATLQDRSLIGSPLEFKTDESIYRVEITEQSQPGTGWSFSQSSSVVTAGFGFLTIILLLTQAAKSTFRDKIVDFITPFAETGKRLFHTFIHPIQAKLGMEKWPGWVPLLLALLVMLLVVTNTAKRGDPGASTAAIIIALLSVGFALLVHELGHGLAARHYNTQTEAAPWAPGIPMALFLMIFNISSGPYPGQRVISENQQTATKVLRAGPWANLIAAILLYALFRFEPLPILRVMAIAQLGVMSYSLLPFVPLDGAVLDREAPRLVYRMATFAAICGALTATGLF